MSGTGDNDGPVDREVVTGRDPEGSPSIEPAKASPDAVDVVMVPRPTRLIPSFRLHRFGPRDPTFLLEAGRWVRAFAGPSGPVTVAMTALDRGHRFSVQAWGDDARWALEQAPRWLGVDDDDADFTPEHPLLRRLMRDGWGLRLAPSPSVFDMFVRLVLQQRVAWREAAESFRKLTLRFGQPAPGPYPLVAALGAAGWRRISLADFAAHDVEAKRARTIRAAAVSAPRFEELPSMSPASANARLRAFPGVGVWTAQGVLGFGLGDPDAVQEQDYDLPRLVSVALSGEPRGDDERMLALLAPYAGQRFRVIRLLMESGIRPPRFGPRRGRGSWALKGRRGR